MARQRASVKVNQFVGGLNTEANLLSFPDGASSDEENMDLLSDGSRRRRNGFDIDSGTTISAGFNYPGGSSLGKGQFLWENVGAIPGLRYMVVQLGNYIGVHSLDSTLVTQNRIHSFRISGQPLNVDYGFASIDGILIITTGGRDVYKLEYANGEFTLSSNNLLVRDFWGVEDPFTTDYNAIQRRPTQLRDAHLYNLRNQSFSRPRAKANFARSNDPVLGFNQETGGSRWPSNADDINQFLVAESAIEENRTVERFNPESMVSTPPHNARAPMGYFIIDALNRGASRRAMFAELTSQHAALQWRRNVTLPADRTPGGATVVAQYSGRVWYGGFRGEIVQGDGKSPRLSSYILFSQVVKDPSQTNLCYQVADPTSHIDADLVSTDGGYIKVDGAYNINALVPADSSLFVFAENGVWRIVGIDENSFSATSYSVTKISDKGCVSGKSVVYVEGTLLYWSESSIFALGQSDVGIWASQDLTESSIKTFYQEIPSLLKSSVSGYYDDVTNTIRWVYSSGVEARTEVYELILNKKFQVFTKNRIELGGYTYGPISVAGGRLEDDVDDVVVVEGDVVEVSGDPVTVPSIYGTLSASQNFYCVLTSLNPIRYSFGGYNNSQSPVDWPSYGGHETPAFLTSGFMTGGEARLRKDIPYLTTYFKKLEEPAGCKLQTRWSWTDMPLTGDWTATRSVYRPILSRDNNPMVITRSKIRGQGKSVAFNLSSEAGAFFHIYGWEHNLDATTDE